MNVEERLARLDAIVQRLEHEQLDLSQSLELFEEGVACLREAAATLTEAEARVHKLIEVADGALALEALDDDE